MKLTLAVVVAGFTMMAAAAAQTPTRVVRATGTASISAKPDQAKITIGVVTQAATAQEAAQQNATAVGNLLTALGKVLGASGDTKTVNYSINPMHRNLPNQPPQITGYSASNTVEVTTSDLSSVGKIIDAAVAAGANNIGALRFSVRDDQPLRAQALAQAAKAARAEADAIASGLNARTGSVLTAEEGAGYIVSPLADNRLGAAATPVEPGLVQIQASVTVTVELLP